MIAIIVCVQRFADLEETVKLMAKVRSDSTAKEIDQCINEKVKAATGLSSPEHAVQRQLQTVWSPASWGEQAPHLASIINSFACVTETKALDDAMSSGNEATKNNAATTVRTCHFGIYGPMGPIGGTYGAVITPFFSIMQSTFYSQWGWPDGKMLPEFVGGSVAVALALALALTLILPAISGNRLV